MRFWIGVSAAFGAGALIGAGVSRILLEDKMKKDYEDSVASMRRVLLGQKINAETPVHTEEELGEVVHLVRHDEDAVHIQGGGVTPVKVIEDAKILEINVGTAQNPYHTPVTPPVLVSYAELDAEEYFDEDDGREKDQIEMIYEDNVPRFFCQGEEIDDAFERVGGTIVDDMRKAVGNGTPVVYIRNNQTDTDYEVIFSQP